MQNQNQIQKKRVIPVRQLQMAMGMAIILSAIAMAFTVSTGGGDKEKESTATRTDLSEDIFSVERERLSDITEHLSGISKIVTDSREQLSKISVADTDAERMLAGLSEALSALEDNISAVDAGLNQFAAATENDSAALDTALAALFSRQQEIREHISSTSQAVYSLLSDAKAENRTRFSETYDRLEKLQSSADKIHKNTKEYHKDLVTAIGLFQTENQEEHTGLAETLTLAAEEMDLLLSEQFSTIQMQGSQEYSSLVGQMDVLDQQIADTGQSITKLLSMMEETGEAQAEGRQEEIREAFSSVRSSLEQVNTDFNSANSDIHSLIMAFKEAETAGHGETLSVLTAMESSMAAGASQNLAQITDGLQDMQKIFNDSVANMQDEIANSFSDLKESESNYYGETLSALNNLENNVTEDAGQNFIQISNSIKGMMENYDISNSAYQEELVKNFTTLNDGLAQYNESVTEQLEQMDTNITKQYNVITNNISESDSGNHEYLESMMDMISGKLESVFQSVSSSKSLLVSALLTKTVSVDQDATFQEIYQGILDISQQVVIGVDPLPGTVSYDYHYHVNNAGEELHTDNCAMKGRCYTIPVYHAHGDACYRTVSYHTHNGSCPGHPFWVDWNPAVPEGYWGWAYDCGDRPNNSSRKELNCSRNGSTIDAYRVGCGLSDGQIIGAHIVYAQEARMLKADIVPAPQEYPDDTEYPETVTSTDEADYPAMAGPADISEDTGKKDTAGQDDPGEVRNVVPTVSGNELVPEE